MSSCAAPVFRFVRVARVASLGLVDIHAFYQDWRRDGTRIALHGLAIRVIKRVAPYDAMYGVQLTLDQLTLPECEIPYETRFLEPHELLRFSESEPTLPAEFVLDAVDRGDRCYAILDGDRLAAYSWYSMRPTLVFDALHLHFDPAYCYMYNGYTHPDYRGQRLHGIGMARALRALTEAGWRGFVSVVDTDNVRSLRSCFRMGYRTFGVIRILGKGERKWIHASAGCAPYGVTLSRLSDSERTGDRPATRAA